MSQRDSILTAASKFVLPFTREQLVVAAWTDDEKLSLKGFPYPDSNKIFAALCGRKGLIAQGLMERRGQVRYALTELGKMRVRELRNGHG